MNVIALPFAFLMRIFNQLTGSYAIALLLFALVVKIVMLPLSIKQQKTQIRTAKLRPKLAAIEKKYAGRTDRKTLEKKQQEIMELQQKEGVSPLGGCLPLLIQLPIILILYGVVQNPLTHICQFSETTIAALRTVAESNGLAANATQIALLNKIETLGADVFAGVENFDMAKITALNFDLFGLHLTDTPTFSPISWLVIIPILNFVFSFLSMKISRKLMGNNPAMQAGGPETRVSNIIMDLMMPLMSFWFALKLPAALGVYWIYQSVLGVAQQFALSKAMPLPTYTEEELRAIQKAEKAKQEAARAAMKSGVVSSKSLHHIDDDDEDEEYVPEIVSKFDREPSDTPAPNKKKKK
ncbi:MAG: YidC/Oxa1 family membrane protein insertase [Clostridia bacterium]|nr:YidC/Oxa1 family membrane protein insertase [Clostridia bacterium]